MKPSVERPKNVLLHLPGCVAMRQEPCEPPQLRFLGQPANEGMGAVDPQEGGVLGQLWGLDCLNGAPQHVRDFGLELFQTARSAFVGENSWRNRPGLLFCQVKAADGPAANKVVIYGALVPRCVEPEGVAKIRPRGRKVEPFEATCHVITRLERNIVWKPGSFLLFREQIFQSHVCRGYGRSEERRVGKECRS